MMLRIVRSTQSFTAWLRRMSHGMAAFGFAWLLLSAVVPAFAQVTLTANVPPYGWLVEPGAMRSIAVYPSGAGALTQKVNWSASGGAALSCTTNCAPVVQVTIPSTATGTASVTGSIGSYVLSSTNDIIVTATSVDDNTKSVSIPFHIQETCSQGTVDVEPSYNQAYQGQQKTLQSYVVGCINEGVTWAITSQPSGGNGTLIDNGNRDTRFSATVSGRYTITATSTANGQLAGSAIIYVSPNPMPSYTTTPNKTEPTECYVDPSLAGTDYEVGPSQPYHDLTTVNLTNWTAGSIVRIHNEDTSGNNPTVYHNATTVESTGTPTQPLIICGVADSKGNLPILDGVNATENPVDGSGSVNGLGAIKIVSSNGICYNQGYNLGPCGPEYLNITGLRIQNLNPPYQYYAPGSTTPAGYGGASGIWSYTGQHMHYEGMDIYNTGQGILANNNTGYSGRLFSQFIQVIGNHISGFSQAYSYGEHALYMEGVYTLVEGNLMENPQAQDDGDFIKMRGGESIIRYNTFRGALGGHILEYPDMQDTYQFMGVDMNLGVPGTYSVSSVAASSGGNAVYAGVFPGGGAYTYLNGQTITVSGFANAANNGTFTIVNLQPTSMTLSNPSAVAETNNAATASRIVDCSESAWCSVSDNITLPQLTMNAEALSKDFAYGNTMSNYEAGTVYVQYGSYSAPNECGSCTNMDDRQGRLYFFNNTMDQPGVAFSTANNSVNIMADPQYSFTTIFAANNAIWSDGVNPFTVNFDTTMLATFQTNLFQQGVMSLTTPISGGSGGWGNYTGPFAYPLSTPMDPHLNGLSTANFLTSPAMPYSPLTFVPVAGSPLIGAGSAITDPEISNIPVRFQPNATAGYMTPRSNPMTIGAVESGTAVTLVSITVTPGSANVAIGGAQLYTAICNYSDGSSVDCTSMATWGSSNNNALVFWNPHYDNGQSYAAGSGYVQATYLGMMGTTPFGTGGTTPPPPQTPVTQNQSAVSIAVGQPQFGFNVLAGSVRRIFATVTNGTTNQVSWAIKSGSATLSAVAGSWVDVTAPATGSSCAFATGSNGWSVNSATQFVVEATAVDDPTQVSDVTFNVCAPKVQVDVVPFYRTLYAKQAVDVQSIVSGSTDLNVHWAITSSPTGGDGALTDTTLRDAIFSATVPGRYVLTATSQADSTVSATAIMYVTGHAMPYRVTPNMTEPVDCSVDPAMLGTLYEVGPSQAFKTLASVPFPTMPAGSTVRLHNEDTTGLNPTTYHEYVQISQGNATAAQPIRICGVPDSIGNLPVMDASSATGRSDASSSLAGYGLITVQSASGTSLYPSYSGPAYLAIEGIKFQNAQAGYSYTAPGGGSGSWSGTSAAIRLGQAHSVAVVGNDIANNGNGVYSDFTASADWGGSVVDVLWEGNHLHGNGAAGSSQSHQMNLQAWNEVVQLNRIESYASGASGANLKSRSLGTFIRYNYLGDGAARQMDLAEVTDAKTYMSFSGYLGGYPNSFHDQNPGDQYTADRLAAAQEEWNSHFIYGNIYQNLTSTVPIHFGYDTDGGEAARKGNLFWYSNTFNEELCSICSGVAWTLFDTQGAAGVDVAQVEFPTVQIYNNVVWAASTTLPVFSWNSYAAFIGVAGANLVPANWGTNDTTGGLGTGWSVADTATAYQNAGSLGSHVTGFNSTNLITASAVPFDPTTWILVNGSPASTAVPSEVCEMPVRFSYLPSLGYAVPRITTPNIGATDTVQEIASEMTTVGGGGHANSRNSNCR